jgi:hypothetical protein
MSMKKINGTKLVAIALAAILITVVAYSATTAEAASETADPLVTRRFVEGLLAPITDELATLRNAIATISPNALPTATPIPGATPLPLPITTPTPGTTTISESDMDELFALVMYYFETMYGERLDAALANIPGPAGEPHPPQTAAFTVLNPQAGQILTFDAGTEFILRGGSAVALTGIYNGIPDVTAGTDVMNGERIGLNHLMIMPVADGRGIVFQSESWLMVRGGYTWE